MERELTPGERELQLKLCLVRGTGLFLLCVGGRQIRSSRARPAANPLFYWQTIRQQCDGVNVIFMGTDTLCKSPSPPLNCNASEKLKISLKKKNCIDKLTESSLFCSHWSLFPFPVMDVLVMSGRCDQIWADRSPYYHSAPASRALRVEPRWRLNIVQVKPWSLLRLRWGRKGKKEAVKWRSLKV